MFREIRRAQRSLNEDICIEMLGAEPRGVLSVIGDDGYPYGMPMDFIFDSKQKKLYFHCALEGHKLDAIKACDKASFCVLGKGWQKEDEWFLHFRSVIVFGKIHIMTDANEKLERLKQLGCKYYPDKEAAAEEAVKSLPRVNILEMDIEHISGKQVKER